MNIQDTINDLGLNEVELPRILKQRVDTIIDLQDKVKKATEEVNSDDSEENKEKLEEVKEYLNEYFDDAVEQLKSFAEKRKQEQAKQQQAKQEQETAKVGSENTPKSEVKEEVEQKAEPIVTEKPTEPIEAEPVKEKSNSGLGALLIGGVILVATLGAVNIMRNR